jgi:hypothetical protein
MNPFGRFVAAVCCHKMMLEHVYLMVTEKGLQAKADSRWLALSITNFYHQAHHWIAWKRTN